jgi:hyperosmotically inducible periplasmic protein
MHHAQPRSLVRALVFGGLIGLASTAAAQTAPDNTKVNKRDRAEQAVTADQQKENATDRELARKIRRALVKDDALSTYAKNVKVIAVGGVVTLKGPVRSEEEKKAVVAKAVEVAGKDHVKDVLSIAPEKPAKTE